jgi:hypothetical protein
MNDRGVDPQTAVTAALASLAARIEQFFLEHHMQREVASVNQRLLDITTGIHLPHHIRESLELYQLHSEMAVIQRRLSQLEGTGAPS